MVAVEEVVAMTTTINPKKLHLELVVAVVLDSLLEKEEKKVPVVEEAKVMKEVVLTGLRVKKEVQMVTLVVLAVLNLSQAKKRPKVVKVAMEQIKKMLTQKMEKKVKVVKDLVEQVEKEEEMVQQFVRQIVIYNLNYKSQYHQAMVQPML